MTYQQNSFDQGLLFSQYNKKSRMLTSISESCENQQCILSQKSINIPRRNQINRDVCFKKDVHSKIYKLQGTQSLQIVSIDDKGVFSINQQAINYMQQQYSQNDYAFCSIMGKNKTGKSFLLNQLFKNNCQKKQSDIAFSIDHTLTPCTKGIWISKQTIPFFLSNKESVNMFMVDTQGIGSYNSTQQIDYKIFLLTMLISDIFCYNNIGPIDQPTLNNLSVGIQISKIFQKQCQQSQQIVMPQLLWILRDFSLQFIDKQQKSITSDQYLQNCLKDQLSIKVSKRDHKNKIRKSIKDLFTSRKCCDLVLPFQDNKIRPQFISGVQQLKNKISQLLVSKSKKSRSNKQSNNIRNKPNNNVQNKSNNIQHKSNTLQVFLEKLKGLVNCLNDSKDKRKFQFPQLQIMNTHLKKQKLNSIIKKISTECKSIRQKYLQQIQNLQDQCNEIQTYLQNKQLLKSNFHEEMNFLYEKLKIQLEKISKSDQKQTLKKLISKAQKNTFQTIKQTQQIITNRINVKQSERINVKQSERTNLNQSKTMNLDQSERMNLDQSERNQNNQIINIRSKRQIHLQNSIILLRNSNSLAQLQKNYKNILQQTEIINKNNEITQLFTKNHKSYQLLNKDKIESNIQISKVAVNSVNSGLNRRTSSLNRRQWLQIQYLQKKVQILCLKQQQKSTLLQYIQYLQTENSRLSSKTNIQLSKHNHIPESSHINQTNLSGYNQCNNCNKSFYHPYIIIGKQLQIKVQKTIVKFNRKGFKHLQFQIHIQLKGKIWNLLRKIKDFAELDHILKIMFPNHQLPTCFMLFDPILQPQNQSQSERQIKMKKQQVFRYLNDLNTIDYVRNTRIFQKFIKINKQYFQIGLTN